MTAGLDQPHIIRATVEDIVHFWQRGFEAARATLVYAVETGMDATDAYQVLDAQTPLAHHIADEQKDLAAIVQELVQQDRNLLSLFRHEVLGVFGRSFISWKDLIDRYPNLKVDWFTASFKIYRLNPLFEDLIKGLVNERIFEMSKRGIGVAYSTKDAKQTLFTFASKDIFAMAIAVFNNLIDNAIKYANGRTVFEIYFDGARSLCITNYGIGMDPAFAERLGNEGPIREGRAEGVEGTGIGWTVIGENLRRLGWTKEIETAPGRGAAVTVFMNGKGLVPVTTPVRVAVDELRGGPPISAAEIAATSLGLFAGARPWIGQRPFIRGGEVYLDLSESPTFKAIERARVLMEDLTRRIERF